MTDDIEAHTEANTVLVREVDPNFGLGALNLAIFCINTFMHPEGSSAEDILDLEDKADLVLDTLVSIRDAVRAYPAGEVDAIAKLLASRQEPPQDDWFMYRQDAEEIVTTVLTATQVRYPDAEEAERLVQTGVQGKDYNLDAKGDVVFIAAPCEICGTTTDQHTEEECFK